MSTITKELTKEQLQQIIETDHVQCGEASSLARIALASLEAEPVGEVSEQRDGLVMDGMVDLGGASTHRIIKGASKMKRLPLGTKFYTAPPAPVSVPDAMEMDDDFDSAFEHGKAVGWNAYRAAMLQSGNFRENKNSSTNNFREIAETSTNYPVIPSEVLSAIQKVAKIRADFDDFDGDRRGIGDCLDEAEQELIVTINKYASQLAAEPIAPNDVREQTAIPQVPV
ncbi:Eaa protein, partial [Escherichia coli]|nr:Eaa protein [Escherichia coli]